MLGRPRMALFRHLMPRGVLRRIVASPSVIYTVPGTIYHAYNETLTRRQNAAPLIFHVVSPGTRAVTAPSRSPAALLASPRRWSSKLFRRCHSLFTFCTNSRATFRHNGTQCARPYTIGENTGETRARVLQTEL